MQRAGTFVGQVLRIERSALAPTTLGTSLLRPAMPSKIHEPCGAHGTAPSRFSATAPGLSTRACGYRTPLSGSGRLYLKPVLGGNRPAPAKSLNLDTPSYLSQVRQTPRSIKSTHYSGGRWRCLAH